MHVAAFLSVFELMWEKELLLASDTDFSNIHPIILHPIHLFLAHQNRNDANNNRNNEITDLPRFLSFILMFAFEMNVLVSSWERGRDSENATYAFLVILANCP